MLGVTQKVNFKALKDFFNDIQNVIFFWDCLINIGSST